ncbi:YrzE family protein [Arthrobacter agilis]|uniref:YrzE family protein n=1 Tax=Arthrobacter agilis TaxID=37921 RepID=UPI002366B63E|nr:YrzE family protein [Arthrobacter agilis]WDF33129.1 YrzE family protein [Arthrobacter agilis]
MSTPAAGNRPNEEPGNGTDGVRRDDATGDTRGRAGSSDHPTEAMDTRSSGSGASSTGGGEYVPGGYSAQDDDGGDYVPGMYSDSPREDDARTTALPTPDRDRTQPTPAAPRSDAAERNEPRTREHTTVAPVTATKSQATGRASEERDHPLPRAAGGTAGAVGSGVPSLADRKLLHQREKEHFGGMKFGSAFFGWLTATGLFVLLSALVGAVAAILGLGADLSSEDLTSGSASAQSTGITAAVILGVVLLLSYYAGGYVAGRMARFSGIKQGVAVWLWAVIVAVVLTVIGFIVGNQAAVTDRFQDLGVTPTQDLTGPGLIGLLVVAGIALIGAILGGLAGMRYHRRIDRADFDALEDAA